LNGKTLTFGEWMSSWCCCSIFRKERRRYSNGVMEDDSTEPPFHTDADHREFVSAGAAAGLAVGVLCCAVLCCAVPCCAVLCCACGGYSVLCCAVPCLARCASCPRPWVEVSAAQFELTIRFHFMIHQPQVIKLIPSQTLWTL